MLKKKNYINKLMRLAFKYNSDDFNVVMWFFGNTKKLDISVYCGVWRGGVPASFKRISLAVDDSEKVRKCCEDMTKVYKAWKKDKTIIDIPCSY